MMPIDRRIIAVVDDDDDDLFLIQQVLNQCASDAEVHFLDSGEALLAYLAQATSLPRLVFLDINMPGMGGLNALAAIRVQPNLQNLCVVMLTTSNSEEDQLLAKELGANDYLVKPSSLAQFSRLVLTTLGHYP